MVFMNRNRGLAGHIFLKTNGYKCRAIICNLDSKYSRVPYFYMKRLLWFLYQQWIVCFKKCSTPRKEFGQLHV